MAFTRLIVDPWHETVTVPPPVEYVASAGVVPPEDPPGLGGGALGAGGEAEGGGEGAGAGGPLPLDDPPGLGDGGGGGGLGAASGGVNGGDGAGGGVYAGVGDGAGAPLPCAGGATTGGDGSPALPEPLPTGACAPAATWLPVPIARPGADSVAPGAAGAPLAGAAAGTTGAWAPFRADDVGPTSAAWTALRESTGVRTEVIVGVSAETPAQHIVVATSC